MKLAAHRAGRLAAALGGGIIGIFLSVKCKAFLIQAWGFGLPVWALLLFTALLAAAAFVFAPSAKQVRDYIGLPLYADALILACCTGIVFLWRDYLTSRALEGSDVTMNGITETLYLFGGGLLLAIFILLNLPALRRIFASIKSVLRSVTRGDICFIATILAAVNLLVFIYAKNSSTIYYWDNAGYWSVSRELAELWKNEGTKRLLEVVFDSVLTLDYNYLIILAALLIRLGTDNDGRADRMIPAGVLLAAAVLMRRWYAFCALAFVLSLVTDCVKRKNVYPLISTVGGFAFTLLFFFQRLVSTKLLADYSSLYVAYKIGLDKDILLLFRYFGIIPLILFFAAGICLLFSKSQRCDAAFLMIWSVLCFCLFVRVQTHGQQHLLMYAPAFICMIILVSGRLEANLHGSKQYTTALTAAGMSLIVSLSPFIPRIQPASLQELKKPTMLPSFSWSPPKRSDAMTVVGLLRYLDSLGAKGLHVGLLASSFTLNQDMLLNSEASLSLPRVSDTPRSYLVYLPDVDQRDGWSDALFKCDILAVADPPQTHLGEENQAVVVRMISTRWMIWSENISQAQISSMGCAAHVRVTASSNVRRQEAFTALCVCSARRWYTITRIIACYRSVFLMNLPDTAR